MNGKTDRLQEDEVLIEPKWVLLPNDFPYYLGSSILHYVLWSTYPITDEEIDAILKSELPSIIGKCTVEYEHDYFYWVNPMALKSIPEVWHAQVLIKIREPRVLQSEEDLLILKH